MEYVKITKDNIDKEHICCAISNNNDPQVISKKCWLKDRIDEGLVFYKSVERGKCFIEYIPAEYAWVPIDACGFIHINCLWVSGSFKGHGYSNDLLDYCINDAKEKGKKGVTAIAAVKKSPFLLEQKFLLHKGFKICDKANPNYVLLYFPFNENEKAPSFKEQAKNPTINKNGFVLYYTNGCPFTAKYVPLIENLAKERKIEFESILIKTKEEAQNAPCAWTNYALFYNGKYVTNEILSENKFLKLVEELGVNNV